MLGIKGFEFCALLFPVGREMEALLSAEMTEPTRPLNGTGADILGFDHVVCRVRLKRRDFLGRDDVRSPDRPRRRYGTGTPSYKAVVPLVLPSSIHRIVPLQLDGPALSLGTQCLILWSHAPDDAASFRDREKCLFTTETKLTIVECRQWLQ